MKRSDHASMHRNEYFADPANAKTIEAANRKRSEWWLDPTNTEAIEAMRKAGSKSLIAYCTDPANVEDIEARGKATSKTKRKNWTDLKVLGKVFVAKEYAETSKVCMITAYKRLALLFKEGQITCEKQLIDGSRYNVYRKTS